MIGIGQYWYSQVGHHIMANTSIGNNCIRFICAFWSPAGKGLTSWLSFVVSNCEFVTFPLVSWVRGGI